MAEDVPQGCDRKPAGLAMDREDEWWLRAPEPLSLFFFSPASFSYALGKRAIVVMLTASRRNVKTAVGRERAFQLVHGGAVDWGGNAGDHVARAWCGGDGSAAVYAKLPRRSCHGPFLAGPRLAVASSFSQRWRCPRARTRGAEPRWRCGLVSRPPRGSFRTRWCSWWGVRNIKYFFLPSNALKSASAKGRDLLIKFWV